MVAVVEAKEEHKPGILKLLRDLDNGRIDNNTWTNCLNNPFYASEKSPGFVLLDENQVVGFFGTIFSSRLIGNHTLNFCNTHSWIVLPKYRNKGLLLLSKIQKLKGYVLTNFSASSGPYMILKKMGWEEKKAEVEEKVMETWGKYVKNLNGNNLVMKTTESPLDIERRIPCMKYGSIKHGEYNPLQMGYFRPNDLCSKTSTPIVKKRLTVRDLFMVRTFLSSKSISKMIGERGADCQRPGALPVVSNCLAGVNQLDKNIVLPFLTVL